MGAGTDPIGRIRGPPSGSHSRDGVPIHSPTGGRILRVKLKGVEDWFGRYRAGSLPAKRRRIRTMPSVKVPTPPRPRDFLPKTDYRPR